MTAQQYYAFMKQELNEKQWRHFLALEALRIGHGVFLIKYNRQQE